MQGIAARCRMGAKRAAYRSGLLGGIHARRNSRTLTAVMFHRVLEPADERWPGADARYTVTPALLGECIEFFRRHYELVDGNAVTGACLGEATLPSHALLVTFDDGWADTAEYALPVLRGHECPATVFVPPPVVGSRTGFWQEQVFAAWKLGTVGEAELERAWTEADGEAPPPPGWRDESNVRELIARLRATDREVRDATVDRLTAAATEPRPQMVSLEQLRELRDAGLELGAHGMSHEPLAELSTASEEIRESRRRLSELLDGAPVRSMSFPHGSYDEPALATARDEFDAVYTSDGRLNPTPAGRLESPVLGRIGIVGAEIADTGGRLRPELLALRLFRRPAG
jgi:peptidoglycan/xylan/chitin deacetylase (PgdA/CDA1 family)